MTATIVVDGAARQRRRLQLAELAGVFAVTLAAEVLVTTTLVSPDFRAYAWFGLWLAGCVAATLIMWARTNMPKRRWYFTLLLVTLLASILPGPSVQHSVLAERGVRVTATIIVAESDGTGYGETGMMYRLATLDGHELPGWLRADVAYGLGFPLDVVYDPEGWFQPVPPGELTGATKWDWVIILPLYALVLLVCWRALRVRPPAPRSPQAA